jgi:hypothetical protein
MAVSNSSQAAAAATKQRLSFVLCSVHCALSAAGGEGVAALQQQQQQQELGTAHGVLLNFRAVVDAWRCYPSRTCCCWCLAGNS